MIAGLTGAHRVGKSSLARSFAKKHGMEFLETSASAIFRELGYDPAVTYDFGTRLTIQEEVLRRFDKFYGEYHGKAMAVTDRTPLDMIAYTLGDVNGETLSGKPELEKRLQKYVNDCIHVTNKRFSALLVVQPGIQIEPAEGKASLSPGYIDHLNSLIMGLAVDERVKVPHYYIPRSMTEMDDRIAALDYALNRVRKKAEAERDELGNSALH